MSELSVGGLTTPSYPQIHLEPSSSLLDEEVHLRVVGLSANQPITISAELVDEAEVAWQSQAQFEADAEGVVDLATQAPLSASYEGVDRRGLWWSMGLKSPEKGLTLFNKRTVSPLTITLQVKSDGVQLIATSLSRLVLAPQVKRTEVRANGLVGTFFAPMEGGPYPGLLVLGGSGGGLNEVKAALLASHGYATLALAYFAYEDLPSSLFNIPLEYFEGALTWLQAQPEVRADRLAVSGASRGGELALLLGATFLQIKAVVAYMPSNVLWGGVGKDVPFDAPAWSYDGISLPVIRENLTKEQIEAIVKHSPLASTPLYYPALEDAAAVEEAAIPVERSQAAILLISGQDDQMWPSSMMADMVMARLAQYNYPYPYDHIAYLGAGHMIGVPGLPTNMIHGQHSLHGVLYDYGGTPKANAIASADSWRQSLRFLEEQLR
jgi:dienelactone hydrolase